MLSIVRPTRRRATKGLNALSRAKLNDFLTSCQRRHASVRYG